MFFTLATAVQAYLPALGTEGALTSDLQDPTSSPSGVLGGKVVALALNIDFSDAGVLPGTSLGDLRICGTSLTVINGMTVRDFLAAANTLLGGGSAAFNFTQAVSVADAINSAFVNGTPSPFAQEHLVNGACP